VRLLVDENFNQHLVRALRRERPQLDVVIAQDVGLGATPDPEILQWAAEQGRVVLTHDVQTFVDYAYQRVAAGLPMPGVMMVRSSPNLGRLVEDLLILIECSADDEINGQVIYVPL
jgi:predicted nuclease of predicted toxin-antitoxin system